MFIAFTKRFIPTELVLLGYLFITLPFIVISILQAESDLGIFFTHILCILILNLVGFIRFRFPTFLERFKGIQIFYPLLFLGFLYKETDALNNIIFLQNLDPWFIWLEELIFRFQPSIDFSIYLPSPLFAESMYFGYFAYYLLLIFVPIILYVKRGYDVANRSVFIIIQSFLIYYLFFVLVPVVGPQFYMRDLAELPRGYLFGDVIRHIQASGEAPTAAFPSSHVAMCLIIIYMVYKEMDTLWIYLLPISILLIFSTVYIRAHYAVDIFAAFITAPLVYQLSSKIYCFFKSRSREELHSPS